MGAKGYERLWQTPQVNAILVKGFAKDEIGVRLRKAERCERACERALAFMGIRNSWNGDRSCHV